nr:hypothetical protein [uncultured Oscillibacter sp.]
MGALGHALLSVLIVLVSGYLGCFMGIAGCIMATVAAAVGCIVYHLERRQENNKT